MMNFDEKLRKVEAIIQIWKQHNFSWKGRIVIIKIFDIVPIYTLI